jgi:hypothetical protein
MLNQAQKKKTHQEVQSNNQDKITDLLFLNWLLTQHKLLVLSKD